MPVVDGKSLQIITVKLLHKLLADGGVSTDKI
jgi:hypothetical protein